MTTSTDCIDAASRAARARTRLNKTKRGTFLDHLAATCNVRAAAAAAKASASAFYQLRRADPAFLADWKAAVRASYDRLEEELLARALREVAADQFDAAAVTLAAAGTLAPAANDPAAAVPAAGKRRATATATVAAVPHADVRLALALLTRRATAERGEGDKPARRRATAAEVEKALNAKLDALAKRAAPLREGKA